MKELRTLPPEENMSCLADRLKWILRESGVRQVDFARSLGISANYVYLLTSGRKRAISEPLARLIEQVYGYPAQWVLTGECPGADEAAARELRADLLNRIEQMDVQNLQATMEFILKNAR